MVELLNIPLPPPTIRIFAGDITIDNIVFYNPMTIYLLTMDNGRGDLVGQFTFSGFYIVSIIVFFSRFKTIKTFA